MLELGRNDLFPEMLGFNSATVTTPILAASSKKKKKETPHSTKTHSQKSEPISNFLNKIKILPTDCSITDSSSVMNENFEWGCGAGVRGKSHELMQDWRGGDDFGFWKALVYLMSDYNEFNRKVKKGEKRGTEQNRGVLELNFSVKGKMGKWPFHLFFPPSFVGYMVWRNCRNCEGICQCFWEW